LWWSGTLLLPSPMLVVAVLALLLLLLLLLLPGQSVKLRRISVVFFIYMNCWCSRSWWR
jgi:hypothetical protein